MTIKEVSRVAEVPYQRCCEFEALRESPWSHRKNDWSEAALRVAAAVQRDPAWLWPDCVLAVAKTKVESEISGEALAQLSVPADLDNGLLRVSIDKTLGLLSPREERILRERFGLLKDGESDGGATLAQVAERGGKNGKAITTERVRGLETAALRKLRHPIRAKHLQAFVIDDYRPPARRCRECGFVEHENSTTCAHCGGAILLADDPFEVYK